MTGLEGAWFKDQLGNVGQVTEPLGLLSQLQSGVMLTSAVPRIDGGGSKELDIMLRSLAPHEQWLLPCCHYEKASPEQDRKMSGR